MVPPPVALGLTLCDYVIVEEGTEKVSLIGTFAKLAVKDMPSEPKAFCAFAALTDGSGDATIHLVITQLETDEEVYASDPIEVQFSDKLTEVRLAFRLEDWSFPAPGWYQFTLLANGEWVAHCLLEVFLKEDKS